MTEFLPGDDWHGQPEQALGKFLEATKAFSRMNKANSYFLPKIAASPIRGSAAAPLPQIRENACGKVAVGHELKVFKEDRIAVSFPHLPEGMRLRWAIFIVTFVVALGFGFCSGWFAQSYVYLAGDIRLTTTGGEQTIKQNKNRSETSEDSKVRTVNREIPIEGRALLDTIAGSESAYEDRDPYKVIYGGRMAESFTDHPRQYVQIVAGPNNGQKTSAAGRYQYLERSWDEASKALGLPDFSPTSQDKAAFWDAQRIYRAKTGRNLVTDIREAEGDPEKLEDIGRGISGWWTSLPAGVEPNEATASFGERFSQNLLYYKDLFRTTVGTGVMTTRKIVSVRSGPPAPDAASARPNWRLSISGSSDLLTEEVLRNAKLAASGPPELRSSQKRWATKSDKIVTGETTHSNESRRLIKTRADVHRGQASTPQITNLVPLPKKRRGAGIDPEAGSARDATLAIPVRAAETARNRGWVLSGIVGGKAFLKDANKFLIVERGDVVPGAGKVTDILRWGNRWVVATDEGLILTR